MPNTRMCCLACLLIPAFAGFTFSQEAVNGTTASETSTLYFAQMADGGGYVTQIMLSNPGVVDVTVTLEAFKSETAGTPLVVTFNGQTSSTLTWKIKAHGSLFLKSAATGARAETGWIRIKATGNVGGSLIYSYLSDGRTIAEAGLDASVPLTEFSLTVDTRQDFYSGVAVANPNTSASEVRFVLFGEDGSWKAQSIKQLAAGEHMAKLMEQIFPGEDFDEFTGLVTVTSSGGPLIATTLRFDGKLGTLSSIPVTAGFPAAPPPAGVKYISITGGFSMASAGEITQLRANANSDTGFLQDVTSLAVWRSSNPAVATISTTGLVTAVAPGLVEITASYGSSGASAGISVATPVDFDGIWSGSSSSAAGSLSWSGKIIQTGNSVSISSAASGSGLYYTANWNGVVNGATFSHSGDLSNAGGVVCTWTDGRCFSPSPKELKCTTPMTCVNGFSMSYITATRP